MIKQTNDELGFAILYSCEEEPNLTFVIVMISSLAPHVRKSEALFSFSKVNDNRMCLAYGCSKSASFFPF